MPGSLYLKYNEIGILEDTVHYNIELIDLIMDLVSFYDCDTLDDLNVAYFGICNRSRLLYEFKLSTLPGPEDL